MQPATNVNTLHHIMAHAATESHGPWELELRLNHIVRTDSTLCVRLHEVRRRKKHTHKLAPLSKVDQPQMRTTLGPNVTERTSTAAVTGNSGGADRSGEVAGRRKTSPTRPRSAIQCWRGCGLSGALFHETVTSEPRRALRRFFSRRCLARSAVERGANIGALTR